MKTTLPVAVLSAAALLGAGLGVARLSHHTRANAAKPASATVVRPPACAARRARVVQPPLPPARLAALRADESGRIPILMYHAFGGPSFHGIRYDKNGLNIAPDTFRKQLALMYAAHWYPVNMRDVLTAHIAAPAGKTPVVLTFDDARGTQFHYLKNGQTDPNCAVGILEAFHARHRDWPLRGTFYVLPQSAWNPAPFWQPRLATRKLRALAADGFEIANHSVTHRLMTRLPAKELTWEMAECQRYFTDRVPGLTMDTMALPGGAWPKNHALWAVLRSGRLGKITYHNRCILMAWGGPSRSWAEREFDSNHIARIGTEPGSVERAIQALSSRRIPPYVSDGNPDTVAVPRAEALDIDPRRLQGARLVVYGNTPKARPVSGLKTAKA